MKRARRRSRTSPTDRDLQAYVDGELDQVKRQEVEEVMRTDAKVRMTVGHYEAQRRGIRRLYQELLSAFVPGRLISLLYRPAPTRMPPRTRGTKRSH